MPHSNVEPQSLRKVGLKVTHQRMRILSLLEASDAKHMSAEDVYKKLLEAGDEIGIATVYRVLNQFESAGLVRRHHFDSGMAVYELDEGEHHDHMYCMETGRVIEFENEQIERLQREIAAAHGYEIEDHRLVLFVRPQKKPK